MRQFVARWIFLLLVSLLSCGLSSSFCLALSLSAPTSAPLLEKSINQAVIYTAAQYLYYWETIDDGVRGFIPGMNLTLMKSYSGYYAEVNSEFEKGPLLYQGGYNSNDNFVALSTHTTNSILHLNAKLGRVMPLRYNLNFLPYLQLGFRQWERAVPPVHYIYGVGLNAYSEEYNNFLAAIGGKLIWQPTENLVLMPNLALGQTFDASIETNVPIALIGTVQVDSALGDSLYFEAGMNAFYYFTENLNANLSVLYDYFEFGASKTVLGRVSEPSSYTNELSLRLGLGFAFS